MVEEGSGSWSSLGEAASQAREKKRHVLVVVCLCVSWLGRRCDEMCERVEGEQDDRPLGTKAPFVSEFQEGTGALMEFFRSDWDSGNGIKYKVKASL